MFLDVTSQFYPVDIVTVYLPRINLYRPLYHVGLQLDYFPCLYSVCRCPCVLHVPPSKVTFTLCSRSERTGFASVKWPCIERSDKGD